MTNKNSKYLFYRFNNYLNKLVEFVKAVRHSKATNDQIAFEVIQNQNWQYFLEPLLRGSSDDNLDDDRELHKKNEIIPNTFQNTNICKTTYNRFYEEVSKIFEEVMSNLPTDENQETYCDLQNMNYYYYLG